VAVAHVSRDCCAIAPKIYDLPPLVDNRLSATDMSSLFAERDQIHVNVGATLIVEGAAPSYEQLVTHVENRLELVPRFRQRIVKVPLGIENPVWADDPEFNAGSFHVLDSKPTRTKIKPPEDPWSPAPPKRG
jgi:hypothetical protein